MRDDSERLNDILEAIANIEKYQAKGADNYFQDELVHSSQAQPRKVSNEVSSVESTRFT